MNGNTKLENQMNRLNGHYHAIRAFAGLFVLLFVMDAVALSSEQKRDIDRIFSRWDTNDGPGMTVGVSLDGETVFMKGYGMANLEYDISNSAESVFHVASISKQFTVFSILLLEEEGKLSLDDEVRKHLPEVPDFGEPVTVRHLIHHTSGLRDQWELLWLSGFRLDDIKTNQDVLDLVARQTELNFPPGERHLYSNTGFTLLALIVEKLSGQSFREFTTEHIFEPLGMEHTHFQDDYNRLVKNRSYGMSPVRGKGYRRNIPAFDTVGATSLFTTAEDLLQWSRNFDGRTVGSNALFEKILKRGRLNNGEQISYAGGLSHGEYNGLRTVGHGGADAGYRAHFERYPDEDLTVVVLANVPTNPARLARRVAKVFLADQMVAPKPGITDSDGRQPSADEFVATESYLDDIVGAYYSPELDTKFTIVREEKGLVLVRKKFENQAILPRGEGRFITSPGFSFVLTRDETDRVSGFNLSTGRILNLKFEKTPSD
jgi:CubicO group peptidase (beta-lactamase class C family)